MIEVELATDHAGSEFDTVIALEPREVLDELIVVGNSDEGLDIALAERGEASDGENGQAAGIRHSGVVDVGDACGVGRVGGLERVREEGAVAREADARFANEARTENVVPANGGAVALSSSVAPSMDSLLP